MVRAIGYGGLDFEDDTPDTLAEAMAVLEAGLARWFEEQGVEHRLATRPVRRDERPSRPPRTYRRATCLAREGNDDLVFAMVRLPTTIDPEEVCHATRLRRRRPAFEVMSKRRTGVS